MTTLLPVDANNNAIPALRLRDDGAHAIAVTGVSARNAVAFAEDTRVISLYATVPVFIRLGNSAVTASTTDHFFPAGTYYDIALGGGNAAKDTHIAVLRSESDGMLYLSEKE